MSSFCFYGPLAFTVYAILTRASWSDQVWLPLSALFIAMGIFGLVFALHDYRLRADYYHLFLIAGNAVIAILYILNFAVFM